jgi:hypothetical protein
MIAATAEQKDHPPEVVEAMVDRDVEIPVVFHHPGKSYVWQKPPVEAIEVLFIDRSRTDQAGIRVDPDAEHEAAGLGLFDLDIQRQ